MKASVFAAYLRAIGIPVTVAICFLYVCVCMCDIVIVNSFVHFQVKASVFAAYLRAIGIPVTVAICFLYVANNAASIYSNVWLSEWSNDADNAINGTIDEKQRDMRLGVYGALGLTQGEFTILKNSTLLMS